MDYFQGRCYLVTVYFRECKSVVFHQLQTESGGDVSWFLMISSPKRLVVTGVPFDRCMPLHAVIIDSPKRVGTEESRWSSGSVVRRQKNGGKQRWFMWRNHQKGSSASVGELKFPGSSLQWKKCFATKMEKITSLHSIQFGLEEY